MSNQGVNLGKNSTNTGDISNNVIIKKSHFVLGVTFSVCVIVTLAYLLFSNNTGNSMGKSTNMLGLWATNDGYYIEFLSDGTLNTNIHDVESNPDTYEILEEEGYLKWGKYSDAWIQYNYTYWQLEINGSSMTLTSKEDGNVISLTKN